MPSDSATPRYAALGSRLVGASAQRTGDAREGGTDESAPPLLGLHPRPHLPRWVVSHVLAVPALQLCDPVPFVVLMKADDAARDRRPVGDHSSQGSTWLRETKMATGVPSSSSKSS